MAGRAELPSPGTETGPWAYGGEGGGSLPPRFLPTEGKRAPRTACDTRRAHSPERRPPAPRSR